MAEAADIFGYRVWEDYMAKEMQLMLMQGTAIAHGVPKGSYSKGDGYEIGIHRLCITGHEMEHANALLLHQ